MGGKTSITNEAFFEYMDSRENIKKALKEIDDFEKSKPMKLFDIQSCHQTITKIKKILESGRKVSDIDKNN